MTYHPTLIFLHYRKKKKFEVVSQSTFHTYILIFASLTLQRSNKTSNTPHLPKSRTPNNGAYCLQNTNRQRIQSQRYLPSRLRPTRDRARRSRNARSHVLPQWIRPVSTLQRRPYHRVSPHDSPNRRPHRDPYRPRRRSPVVLMQHLLNPRPRCRRNCPWLRRGFCMERRDLGRVLVVYGEGFGLGLRLLYYALSW